MPYNFTQISPTPTTQFNPQTLALGLGIGEKIGERIATSRDAKEIEKIGKGFPKDGTPEQQNAWIAANAPSILKRRGGEGYLKAIQDARNTNIEIGSQITPEMEGLISSFPSAGTPESQNEWIGANSSQILQWKHGAQLLQNFRSVRDQNFEAKFDTFTQRMAADKVRRLQDAQENYGGDMVLQRQGEHVNNLIAEFGKLGIKLPPTLPPDLFNSEGNIVPLKKLELISRLQQQAAESVTTDRLTADQRERADIMRLREAVGEPDEVAIVPGLRGVPIGIPKPSPKKIEAIRELEIAERQAGLSPRPSAGGTLTQEQRAELGAIQRQMAPYLSRIARREQLEENDLREFNRLRALQARILGEEFSPPDTTETVTSPSGAKPGKLPISGKPYSIRTVP